MRSDVSHHTDKEHQMDELTIEVAQTWHVQPLITTTCVKRALILLQNGVGLAFLICMAAE